MVISMGDVEIEINSEMDIALRKELLENASVILTMLRGTNPLDRAMGLSQTDIIGQNVYVARGAYMVQAIEQIEIYEPRLAVTQIDFKVRDSKLIPKVVCTYHGN